MSRGVDWEEVIFKSALAFMGIVIILMIVGFGIETGGIVGGVGAVLIISLSVCIGYAHETGYIG